MQRQTYQKHSKSLLSSLDVFGVEISLKYENQKKYKTRLGGLITVIVIIVLATLFYQQISIIINKENPNVLFQQVHVENPSRYDMNPENYTLMVTLMKKGLVPWIDETYYTVQAIFHEKLEETQPDGSIKSVQYSHPLQIGPCTPDDFQFEDVKSYFLSIDYKNCYCIKDKRRLYLQGQFERKTFTDIQFKFLECTGVNCQPQPEIQAALKVAKAQIYYTNRILSLSKYEKPFTAVGKTIFYNIFYEYFVSTGFLFTNTFVTDDIGLFTEQKSTQKDLIFTQDRFQLASRSGGLFFQCTFYLEKDREDQYRRTYKKLSDVVSQLGGIFNVLFLLGSIFARPYNNLQLQKKLYQDLFDKKKPKQQQQKKNLNLDQSKQNKKSQCKVDNAETILVVEDQHNNTENFRDKFLNVIQSYLRCFKCFKNDLTDMLDFSQHKLDSYTNIKTIINTIIQFHKVEYLVLGENTFLENSPKNITDSRFQQQVDLDSKVISNYQLTPKDFRINKNSSPLFQNKAIQLTQTKTFEPKRRTEDNNEFNLASPCHHNLLENIDQNILQTNDIISLNTQGGGGGVEQEGMKIWQSSLGLNKSHKKLLSNSQAQRLASTERPDASNIYRFLSEQKQNSLNDISDEPHSQFGYYKTKKHVSFISRVIQDNQNKK